MNNGAPAVRRRILIGSFLAAVLFAPFRAETDSATNMNPVTAAAGSVILVTASSACPCTLKRCQSLGDGIRSILTNSRFGQLVLEEIDYSTEKERAESCLAKCPSNFIPVLMVLDGSGVVLYSASGEYARDEVIRALDRILPTDGGSGKGEGP
jgi:hypothetical protein